MQHSLVLSIPSSTAETVNGDAVDQLNNVNLYWHSVCSPILNVDDTSTSLKEVEGHYEREVSLKYLHSYNWQIKRVTDELCLPVVSLVTR